MELINVITIINGFVDELKHFKVDNDKDKIEKAEDYFIETIEKLSGKNFSEDEKIDIISEGYYEFYNEHGTYNINLIWTFPDF